jgi:two-component system, chemotaxis family, CheB/CheR fusion protein
MAEKIMNLIPADIGRSIKDLNLRVGIPDLESLLIEVIDSVTTREFEVRDEKGRWHLVRLRPYRTTENKIDGAVIALIDIDSIKRDEQTLRRQKELLDQAYDAIVMWDLDGTITYWNAGAEQTFGYPRQIALGRTMQELLGSSIPAQQLRTELEAHGNWSGELTRICQNKTAVEVESRMVLARDVDGNRVVIEASRPITERKRLENELRARANELLAADRAKDEFMAMLAHELRNPLAALHNAAEIFKRTSPLESPQADIREIVAHQVDNMARMVDDLLDVARLTGRGPDLRKSIVDLNEVARRAMEMTRPEFERRNQTLSASVPDEAIAVEGDAVRLEQVLGNLLVNASKFSPTGGRVWLSVRRDGGGTDGAQPKAIIKIRDEGVGIGPELLPHVFEQFMQGEQSLDRSRGGLGIGLTLAKRLVDLHGGSIEAFSKGPGEGSEFTVLLPIVGSLTGPMRASSQTRAEPSLHKVPRRVLVVDDNVDSAVSLRMLLEMDGHQVDVAHDGPTALQKIEQIRPQVALLDIGLPGMDGYQVARALRRDPLGGSIWLVAVSGYSHAEHRRSAKEAGFDRYLVKPVDADAFRELLENLPERLGP